MFENGSTLNTDTELTMSQLKDQFPPDDLILPGILHFASKNKVNYLTLIKTDRVSAKVVYDAYFKLCHTDYDIYEHANFYEACRTVPEIVNSLDKFKAKICDICSFTNYPKKDLKVDPEMDKMTQLFYREEMKKFKPNEKRAMRPIRGQYSWTYQCEKCYKG